MRLGMYIFLRMWGMILQIIGGLVIIFFLFNIIPYDPVGQFLFAFQPGSDAESQAIAASLRAGWGLDKPILVQVSAFLVNLLQTGSFGESWFGGDNNDLLRENLPLSLVMLFVTLLFYIPLSIILGVATARRNRKFTDFIVRIFTSIFYGIPYYIFAVLLIAIDGVPGTWASGPGVLQYFPKILAPIGIAILVYTSFQYRLVRTELRLILRKNYIRTAYAKGLSERRIIYKHAIRNALPAIVLSFTITIPLAISTLAVLEYLFGLPGIGTIIVSAAISLDWGIIIGISTVFLMLNSFLTFLADVILFKITPKK